MTENLPKTSYIRFLRSFIKNIRNYGEVELPLADQGVVSVLGPNGAGKSTMWEALEVAFYGATSKGHKRDELTKNSKDALIEEDVMVGDRTYRVSYSRNKKKWVHKIYELKNGEWEDLGYHGATDAQNAAKILLGFAQKEFEGAVHLTQSGQHILIEGKPSERKDYISRFFGIDERYDVLLSEAKSELEKTQKELEKYPGYIQSKEMLEQELNGLVLPDLVPIKNQIVSLTEGSQISLRSMQQWESIQIKALQYSSLVDLALSIPDVEKVYQSEQTTIIEKKSEIKNIEAKAELVKRARIAQAKVFEIEDSLIAYLQTPDQFDQDMTILQLNQKKTQDSHFGRYHSEFQKLQQFDFSGISELPALKEEFTGVSHRLRDLSNKLAAIKSGVCPTCSQPYPQSEQETDKTEHGVLSTRFQQIQVKIQSLESLKVQADRFQQLAKDLEGFVPWTSQDESQLQSLLKLKNDVQNKTSIQQSLQFAKQAVPQLDSFDIPNIEQMKLELQSLEFKNLNTKKVYDARMALPEKPEASAEAAAQNIQGWKATYEQQNTQLKALRDQEIQANNILSQYQRTKKQIEEISKLLVRYDELKKDEFFWIKMAEAYGPKGLRIDQLNSIMEMVMKRLPYYTGILFEEKAMLFTHSCDAASIDITVERGPEKERYSYDISAFSGGEMRRMSLAFMLALADCVSVQKRANILVLDEVDAHLDAYGKRVFIEELLPGLRTQYESIFVISHEKDIQQAAVYDQVWYVEMQDHTSSVRRVKL